MITDKTDARDLWSICGSFGTVAGQVKTENGVFSNAGEAYIIESTTDTDDLGVTIRRDIFTNISAEEITVNSLLAKFAVDSGEYEVYTQYNGWQNESEGGWQPLVSGVSAAVESVRTCAGATPMLALWNRQSGRGRVFHLIPGSAWELTARRVCAAAEASAVVVEAGMNRHNFAMKLLPGESVRLPEIIYYDFTNKTDFDCYKLHGFCNGRCPGRELPVIYNTWLCRFDRLTFENVSNQIEPAARIGAEYFVIDAGWFGNGDGWFDARGDWEENQSAALAGRMGEIADAVRGRNMKFGFWLEVESASPNSAIVENHPEYFIEEDNKFFLDFTNPAAYNYILKTVVALVSRYKAEFLKLDFNQDMFTDPRRAAFADYLSAYGSFIAALRKACPGIYLQCCASGGMRMNLSACDLFDGVWLSDDQDVYEGIRIYKDTLLRMPPNMIEKWAVLGSTKAVEGYETEKSERLLSTRDAACILVGEVRPSLVRGFFEGGPIGFSFDLNGVSEAHFESLKSSVEEFKRERGFWQTAVCRILCDSESLIVLQHSDSALTKIKITAFSGKIRQADVRVFPAADSAKSYRRAAEIISGAKLAAEGICIKLDADYEATSLLLEAVGD